MTQLFPQNQNLIGAPMAGVMQVQGAEEELRQQALQSQLKNLKIAREQMAMHEAQQNIPLRDLERQVNIGAQEGALARQPFELSRQEALARAASNPDRLSSEVEAGDLEAEGKARAAQMKKTADEMELFMQAFQPMLEATAKGDLTAANQGWDSAFDLLEKNKVPGVAGLRVQPRETLLANIRTKYQQALNTAPTIRERLKAEEDHKRKLEEIKATGDAQAKVAKTRVNAERPVNTREAVGARLLDKYNKNPGSLSAPEADTLTEYLETNWSKSEIESYEAMYPRQQAAFVKEREARLRRNYSHLYNRKNPVKPKSIYEEFGIEPPSGR